MKKLFFILMLMAVLVSPALGYDWDYEDITIESDYSFSQADYSWAETAGASTKFELQYNNNQADELIDYIIINAQYGYDKSPTYVDDEGTFEIKYGGDVIGSGTAYFTYMGNDSLHCSPAYFSLIFDDGGFNKADLPAGTLTLPVTFDWDLHSDTYFSLNLNMGGYYGALTEGDFRLSTSAARANGFWIKYRSNSYWKGGIQFTTPDTFGYSTIRCIRDFSDGSYYSRFTIKDGETELRSTWENYNETAHIILNSSPSYVIITSTSGANYSYNLDVGEYEESTTTGITTKTSNIVTGNFIASELNLSSASGSTIYSLTSGTCEISLTGDTVYNYSVTSTGYDTLFGTIQNTDMYGVYITEYDSTYGQAQMYNNELLFKLSPTETAEANMSVYTAIVQGQMVDSYGIDVVTGLLSGAVVTVGGGDIAVTGDNGYVTFDLSRYQPYTITAERDGYIPLTKAVNITSEHYIDYFTLEIDPNGIFAITATPTATPIGYNETTGETEQPKNVLESIQYAIENIFGVQTLTNTNLILSAIIILFFGGSAAAITKDGMGFLIGSIVGFVITLGLGLMPLWVFFAMILMGLLWFGLSKTGGE